MTPSPSSAEDAPPRRAEEWRREHDMRRITLFMGSLVGLGSVTLLALVGAASGQAALAGLLWALALLTSGMAVGFLFGVPKVRQGGAGPEPEGREAGGAAATRRPTGDYQQRVNTNLEEISDWLTKILVGMGLVNLKELPTYLGQLGRTVGDGLGAPGQHAGLGLATALFFGVAGFLYGYLMTRLYLQTALARAEAGLSGMLERLREVDEKAEAALSGAAQSVGAGGARGRPAPAAGAPPREAPLATLSGALSTSLTSSSADEPRGVWQTDPHKGFADGRSQAAGRRLAARLAPIGGSDACRVHFELSATHAARPLRGAAVFHLHPTFAQPDVTVMPDADGVARLNVVAVGAFTVGVEADGGSTKLELDLVDVPGGTAAFYAN